MRHVHMPNEAPDVADGEAEVERDGEAEKVGGDPAHEEGWHVSREPIEVAAVAVGDAAGRAVAVGGEGGGLEDVERGQVCAHQHAHVQADLEEEGDQTFDVLGFLCPRLGREAFGGLKEFLEHEDLNGGQRFNKGKMSRRTLNSKSSEMKCSKK